MPNFSRIKVSGWRQFDAVDIDLSKQVTILTGQNGCGKTTILNLLSRHFGWNINFVSTPYVSKRTAKRIWSDLYNSNNSDVDQFDNNTVSIGSIEYDNDVVSDLRTKSITGAQYNPEYANMCAVDGIHIPSHRPIATYTNVESIPTEPVTSAQHYQQYQALIAQYHNAGKSSNPGLVQKRSLISLALFGEGNSNVTPNPDMKKLYIDFQRVLRSMLPESIGFERIEIRMPEVVLVTKSGTFSLDAMSGGVNAIFSIAWQIYMFGYDKDSFVLTIDEPENHLHPNMQRTFIPKLATAFPNCRIIAATHSPLIVSSYAAANVVALMRNGTQRIISEQLDLKDISGTPNEVLREILDVRSNLPVWVESEIERLIRRSDSKPQEKRAKYIMDRLKKLGIADAIVEYKRRSRGAGGN